MVSEGVTAIIASIIPAPRPASIERGAVSLPCDVSTVSSRAKWSGVGLWDGTVPLENIELPSKPSPTSADLEIARSAQPTSSSLSKLLNWSYVVKRTPALSAFPITTALTPAYRPLMPRCCSVSLRRPTGVSFCSQYRSLWSRLILPQVTTGST